jgi:hypothetical protein
MYINVPVKPEEDDLDIMVKIQQAIEDYGNEMAFEEGHVSKISWRNFKNHVRVTIK